MIDISTYLPFFLTMVLLMTLSAFFSSSEAAFFYLRRDQRKALAKGNRPERIAAKLLENPDRLLASILFWNLLVNVAYFALASIVAIKLKDAETYGNTYAAIFAIVALIAIIFFSEMLPKSIGVAVPLRLVRLFSIPLAVAVNFCRPFMPVLDAINKFSQRIIWPKLQREPYLEVSDLERAINLSVDDADLIEHEHAVLQNIVVLSRLRVDEWMRPRSQFTTYQPPVSIEDMRGKMPQGEYLLITEKNSEEIESALRLSNVTYLPQKRLETRASKVMYAPWCTPLAQVLQKMRNRGHEVTVVVNEYGESIGLITIDDILDTIFNYDPSRIEIMQNEKPILSIGEKKWQVNGMTSLRKLRRVIKANLPESTNVTLGGVIYESLQRDAEPGDECEWGPLQLKVKEVGRSGKQLGEVSAGNGEVA